MTMAQVDLTQLWVLFGPVQAWPQAPQWAMSASSDASQPLALMPSQSPYPASHEATVHRPMAQAGAPCATAPQAFPQPSQFIGSEAGCTSQPLLALPSQSSQPAAHCAIPHAPLAHAAVACVGSAQTLAQPAQLRLSDWPSTSHPSVGLALQWRRPVAQVSPHTPPLHEGVAYAPPGQALAQRPQLVGSSPTRVSHP